MGTLLWIDEKPLREKLDQNLSLASEAIKKLEVEVDGYFSRDLPQFQVWINTHYAKRLEELSALEKAIRQKSHKVEETMHLSLQMDVPPEDLFTKLCEEGLFQNSAKDEKTQEELCDHNDIEEASFEDDQNESNPRSVQARNIFYRIARCVHPDVRGQALSSAETDLWVRAQQAYAKNDSFELQRLEQCLRCGAKVSPLAYSELLQQLEDFNERLKKLEGEIRVLKQERAWNFSEQEDISSLQDEIESEMNASYRMLKKKDQHLEKTLDLWTHAGKGSDSKMTIQSGYRNLNKNSKRASSPGRSKKTHQSSLFDV